MSKLELESVLTLWKFSGMIWPLCSRERNNKGSRSRYSLPKRWKKHETIVTENEAPDALKSLRRRYFRDIKENRK